MQNRVPSFNIKKRKCVLTLNMCLLDYNKKAKYSIL